MVTKWGGGGGGGGGLLLEFYLDSICYLKWEISQSIIMVQPNIFAFLHT